jgi:hypothetical protein
MSIDTWKNEFYPTGAEIFVHKENNLQNAIEATEHSLLKWKGLSHKNITKHDLYFKRYALTENKYSIGKSESDLVISGSSCACCRLTTSDYMGLGIDCKHCPIYFINGHDCNDIYGEWNRSKEPDDMITLLEDTLSGLNNAESEEYEYFLGK